MATPRCPENYQEPSEESVARLREMDQNIIISIILGPHHWARVRETTHTFRLPIPYDQLTDPGMLTEEPVTVEVLTYECVYCLEQKRLEKRRPC